MCISYSVLCELINTKLSKRCHNVFEVGDNSFENLNVNKNQETLFTSLE